MSLIELSIVGGIVSVGGSVIYACIRVGLVAGRTDGRLSNLSDRLQGVTASLERFVEKADERLSEHAEKIGRHDERLTYLERTRASAFGRRDGEHP